MQHGVALGATPGQNVAKPAQPEITQRDLRNRSKEIMDAVESGRSFTVTRDGHEIGELIPLRRRRRFVSRAELAAMSRNAARVDTDAFRADQESALDQEPLTRNKIPTTSTQIAPADLMSGSAPKASSTPSPSTPKQPGFMVEYPQR